MSGTTGIAKRITKALKAFLDSDLEEALYQIAPAIDVTGKKRYPLESTSQRVKKFLKDEQEVIYGFSTQNRFLVGKNTKVLLGEDGPLEKIIYTYIRCPQAHEAEYDKDKIVLGGEFGVGRVCLEGYSPGIPANKYLISKATVLALIFSVICAPENIDIGLSGSIMLFNKTIDLSSYLGKRREFIEFYSAVFCPG